MKVRVVTANRTLSGAVVYFTEAGDWSPHLTDAFWSTDKDVLAERLATAGTQQALLCDPYLLLVEYDDETLSPRTKREQIRADGPETMLEGLGYGQSFLRAAQGLEEAAHVSL